MKKRTVAIAIMLVLVCSLLAACSGGNGGNGGNGGAGDTIVGTWASADYSGAYVYTFNEDGSGNYDASGTQMPFTYTAEDGKLSILYDGNTAPFETTYTISGKTLTMKDSFDNDVVYNRK